MAEKNTYLTGDQLQVGMRVLHDRFGQGTVVGSTGEVTSAKTSASLSVCVS